MEIEYIVIQRISPVLGFRMISRARNILLYALLLFLTGCASKPDEGPSGEESPSVEFSEAYEQYPAVASSGVSRHLVRSHTTGVMVRPASSVYEFTNRLADHIWDTFRRLEIRFVRFPMLNGTSVSELEPGSGLMDLVQWEEWLDRMCGRETTTARLKFIIGGEVFFETLEAEIDGARSSIAMQIYLFDNDDVAADIASRLKARSRDVDVRVMYDGLGTYLSHMATATSQPADTEFIESIPAFLCEDSNIRVRVVPNILFAGNHCKCILFDNKTAYIGGMNIGREYRYDWHDMMIRLEGRAVERLVHDFEDTWRHTGWGGDFAMLLSKPPKPITERLPGEVPVRLLYTYPARAEIYRAQLEAIRRARSYIYIENAYFADDRILYELCRARRRGVDVRVIMPAVVNHKIMEHSNKIAINTLLAHGAKVYLYPGMSHIKAAVYDGWICVGTANFDKLSLQINRELNLATSNPETAALLLERLFEPDFAKSEELTDPVSLDMKDHLIELIGDET